MSVKSIFLQLLGMLVWLIYNIKDKGIERYKAVPKLNSKSTLLSKDSQKKKSETTAVSW